MAGRGRGNFKPKQNTDIKFNNETLTQLTNIQGPRGGIPTNIQFEDASNDGDNYIIAAKYENLVLKILSLKADDDGILMNQKYKHILETWQNIAETSEAVQEALDIIHRRGLYDAAFATKLVNMLSSLSFNSVEIHNVKIRNQFISKLQHDFDNCKILQAKSPIAFRNAVRMLGEFYHKARLKSGKPIGVFVAPLTTYLEMLLDAGQDDDIELFTMQLYMNGNSIRSAQPEKLCEILLKVRQTIALNERLSTTTKFWLLMALDAAKYNFGLLPEDLQAFYINHLGERVINQFERINTELTIQTIHKNDMFDKIISNVTVLKVDNGAAGASINNWDGSMAKVGGGDSFVPSSDQITQPNNNLLMKTETSNFKPNYENHDGPKPSFGREKYLVKAQTYKKITPETNINHWETSGSGGGGSNTKRDNQPRPILGVGARLHVKMASSDDGNWRDRTSDDNNQSSGNGGGSGGGGGGGDWRETKSELNPTAAGWESTKSMRSSSGGGWFDSNKESTGGGKKTWSQHDDRTENNYSNT